MPSNIGYNSFTINGLKADGGNFKRGDDLECLLVVYGNNEGASIDFVAKSLITDSDDAAIVNKTGTDGGTGQAITVTVEGNTLVAKWNITSVETENFLDGVELIYGIQMRKGTKTQTIEEGSFKLSADVVRKND